MSSYSDASGSHATPARLMHQPLAGPCRSLAGEALVDPVLANDSPTRELSCPFEERLARSPHDKTVRMQPCERRAAAACARGARRQVPRRRTHPGGANALTRIVTDLLNMSEIESLTRHNWQASMTSTLQQSQTLVARRPREVVGAAVAGGRAPAPACLGTTAQTARAPCASGSRGDRQRQRGAARARRARWAPIPPRVTTGR
eukprot:scaffold100071_cov69-Phaeocystis_antarctica.AAC.5